MSYFQSLGRDISVYSGTHGVLEFPDVNNNHQQIYLYNKEYIPAPLYYWKVLQDKVMMIQHGTREAKKTGKTDFFQSTNTAAAFIGLNDPHEKSVPLELCTNR